MNHRFSSEFRRRIGYQCFVDSFAGAVPVKEKTHLYPKEVYGRPVRLLDWSEEFSEYSYGYAFYGGDLPGVTNAINTYLADLGIGLLYLTPVFQGESNHKYDTVDYMAIDPQFGDADAFRKLVETCHGHGMQLILDGVFNHTSYHHPWHLKAREGEAPFVDYYKKNEAGHFLLWNGIETLPLLNHKNPDVRDYLYESRDSVVKHWLRQGADGWRLDVAERLGKPVIQSIRESMRADFPEKMLFGEVIETYGKEWLEDGLLDGAMNYVFLGNTVNFLTGKIDGGTFLYELNKMVEEYPSEKLYNCWNIISTHDTNRMIFEVGGNENLFKMAVILQFTYPGLPMIYNGDELGVMPGQKDRSNRQGLEWERVDLLKLKSYDPWKSVQPMDWKRINECSSFHHFYRHLIWLRKNHAVLGDGSFVPAYSDKEALAYFRLLDEQCALIVLNKGATREIAIPVPEHIRKLGLTLKGVHGPIGEVRISGETLTIPVNCENALIFIN